MRKSQQRELERLERALMEADDTDLYMDEEAAYSDYDMYNADDTDVDLDDYSEEVYRQTGHRGMAVTMAAMIALSACILLLLRLLGVF